MYEPPQQQPPQDPYQQQQQSYQPPPFQQQPGYEQPPPYVTPAPPPKKKTGKVLAIVFGVIIALLCCCGVGAVVFWNSDAGKGFREGFTEELNSNPENAKVGDCITDTVKEDASDAKVVKCDKPEAKNKVVGIVPNVTEAEFDTKNQTICEAYPEWETVLWFGRKGARGKALCLAPTS